MRRLQTQLLYLRPKKMVMTTLTQTASDLMNYWKNWRTWIQKAARKAARPPNSRCSSLDMLCCSCVMSFDARMNVKPIHTSSMPGPKSRRRHRLRNCAFSFVHPMVDNVSSILPPMSPRLLGKVARIETLQAAPRLPPELWLGIAAQCTQSTIAVLAHVQRSWYLALESELYRHMSVVFLPGDLVTSQACIRLLWSLAQTPRRATLVHSLSVNTYREAMTACDQCNEAVKSGHRGGAWYRCETHTRFHRKLAPSGCRQRLAE